MFATRLKELRNKRNLTQGEFARELGIKRANIAGYESQGKEPTFERLIIIADYFNVSLDYLLGRDEVNINVDYMEVFNTICSLSDHIKANCSIDK